MRKDMLDDETTTSNSTLPPPPAAPEETLADLDAERERFKVTPESADDEPESQGVPDFTLEDVGRFCYERQAIWHRRFVENLPAPWTEDETLREWRICNIFRELDRGTQYCREHVAERRRPVPEALTSPMVVEPELEDQKARLFNTAVYRLLNRSDSWEKYVGWLESPYEDALRRAVEQLEEASAAGEVVSTNTWRASTLSEFLRSSLLVADQLDELHELCSASSSLKMTHAILSRGYEIGDFTAYQVALDLQFVYPNLDNSDWVFVYGRGTRRKDGHGGSMWALKKIDPLAEPIDTCRRLRDTQDEWLPAEWSEVAWPERPRLALVDVDNLMCEFRKYWNKRHGVGSLRRFGEEPPKPRRVRAEGRRNRSASTNWETPPGLFSQLNEERGPFTVDAAASSSNALLERYWDIVSNGLRQSWASESVFCHPPFGEIRDWTAKAVSERERAHVIVMLVPAYLDTKWWYENIVGTASEIRFIKGQVQFNENGEPRHVTFQSALAVVTWYPTKDSEPFGPVVDWGYTWPGRVVVPRAGWTGT